VKSAGNSKQTGITKTEIHSTMIFPTSLSFVVSTIWKQTRGVSDYTKHGVATAIL